MLPPFLKSFNALPYGKYKPRPSTIKLYMVYPPLSFIIISTNLLSLQGETAIATPRETAINHFVRVPIYQKYLILIIVINNLTSVFNSFKTSDTRKERIKANFN